MEILKAKQLGINNVLYVIHKENSDSFITRSIDRIIDEDNVISVDFGDYKTIRITFKPNSYSLETKTNIYFLNKIHVLDYLLKQSRLELKNCTDENDKEFLKKTYFHCKKQLYDYLEKGTSDVNIKSDINLGDTVYHIREFTKFKVGSISTFKITNISRYYSYIEYNKTYQLKDLILTEQEAKEKFLKMLEENVNKIEKDIISSCNLLNEYKTKIKNLK